VTLEQEEQAERSDHKRHDDWRRRPPRGDGP
jgi:hypothetical protein